MTKTLKITKRLIAVASTFLLVLSLVLLYLPQTAYAINLELTSSTAIVMDHETGVLIYERGANIQRVPASMTKMIAVYVVLDAIEAGVVSFDTIVPTSAENAAFSVDRAFSNIPMPEGSFYTLRTLIEASVIRSAGAATVQMGEAVFGTEAGTVAAMNRKMQELGIEANFVDSWGISAENSISAYGMARVTQSLINSHPVVLEITAMPTVVMNGIAYDNTNRLLDVFEGVDGFKTGFTNAAGWCFAGTAVHNGRRYITVTMGSSQGHMFYDTEALLNFGFSNLGLGVANHVRREILERAESSANIDDGTSQIRFSPLAPISHFQTDLTEFFTITQLAQYLNEYP